MKMNLSFAKQWAKQQIAAGDNPIAAQFIIAAMTTPAMDADKLIAIQRSFEPIDDAGTLRTTVSRQDVELLLAEVIRLRAAEACSDVVVSPEIVIKEREESECHDRNAQSADENAAPSEPASTATSESATSAAVSVDIGRQASRSPRRR